MLSGLDSHFFSDIGLLGLKRAESVVQFFYEAGDFLGVDRSLLRLVSESLALFGDIRVCFRESLCLRL
jgi:hypothetical protein